MRKYLNVVFYNLQTPFYSIIKNIPCRLEIYLDQNSLYGKNNLNL